MSSGQLCGASPRSSGSGSLLQPPKRLPYFLSPGWLKREPWGRHQMLRRVRCPSFLGGPSKRESSVSPVIVRDPGAHVLGPTCIAQFSWSRIQPLIRFLSPHGLWHRGNKHPQGLMPGNYQANSLSPTPHPRAMPAACSLIRPGCAINSR